MSLQIEIIDISRANKMLNITKENNSIRVEATDYSFYPFNGVVTYPSNSVIVVTDKSNMATFKSSTNGDVLFVGNINELTIDGNKVTKDTIVGEFTKIANASASVDAYTKAESDAKYALKTDHDTLAGEVTTLTTNKQDKLTAGTGITIDGNTISATGGGSGSVSGLTIDDKKVTAGFNQEIGLGGESTPPNGIVAIGKGAAARLDYVTAVGFIAKGQGTSATAVGDRSNAAAALSTAIGHDATANDTSAIALGDSASAGGYSSIAIGQNANASGRVSIALGDDSKATVDNPLVINAGEYKDKTCITMIKGSSVGKISIPAGDGSKVRMVLQDEINSLKSEVATLKSQLVTLTNKLNTINGEDI